MKTLEHWKSRFTETPFTIECSEMRLLTGRDHEPPVFVGPGHIDIRNSTEADFKLFASPPLGSAAIERVFRAHSNPYEMLDQFRLLATDFEGTEWACGWIVPRMEGLTKNGGLLTGKINSLLTHVTAEWVSSESSVELLFQPAFHLPMESSMLTVHSIGDEEVERSWQPGKHTLVLLGSTIEFFKEPTGDALWVTANSSADLPHPFLENWLSEPFRILLGQLIYPRLVARNLGDGSAQVWVRRSPRPIRNASIGALLASELAPTSRRFWELYAALLIMIANARDEQGTRNFEKNRVTRFYEEIIQASQGSRWVLCMTLASTAEGLAKLLMKPEDHASEYKQAEIEGVKEAIQAWKGNKDLKARVLDEVSHVGKKSISKFMRKLEKLGALESRHGDAWDSVRNKVMHGNLVAPWSSKEEDEQIIALGELVHALTRIMAGVNG